MDTRAARSWHVRAGSTVLAWSALVAGCAREVPAPAAPSRQMTPSPTPAAIQTSGPERAELDRLRALGYLDDSDLVPQDPGEGTVRWDTERTCAGYTLVVYSTPCSCDLISLDGEVVNSWSDSPCRRWEQVRLLPDGDLLVVGTRASSDDPAAVQIAGRYLMRLDWSGEVVWRRSLAAHHDVRVTPEGRLLTLLIERRLVAAVDPEVEIWDDVLALLDQDGAVVERLSLYDVLASSKLHFPLEISGRVEKNGERWIDLFHCNAAEWLEPGRVGGEHPLHGPDTVLVTSRHQDAVMAIDWSARELVWHWGRGELSGPHDGTLQADGNLLVFDNGLARGWSRVVEVNPLARLIVREYTTPRRESFSNRVMGSNQRLPNGNVLITNSAGGQGLELTAGGQPVWVYMGTRRTESGRRAKVARMRRVPPGVVDGILGRAGGS